MKAHYRGCVVGLPYGVFALLFPTTFVRVAHVLFPSLGIVVGLSLIATERKALQVKNCLVSGLFALLIFTVGSVRSPFLTLRTWIFEESEDIVVYTGVQNWLVGCFFSMAALYLTVGLWGVVVKKSTPVQRAGVFGGVLAALPWTLSGKYGVPSEYDCVISVLSYLVLALPGFILLKYREPSVRKGITSGGIAWSIWAFLVITAILYTGPRMWIFSDNWDFVVSNMSILARYLPVWIVFSSLVLVLGRGVMRVLTSD